MGTLGNLSAIAHSKVGAEGRLQNVFETGREHEASHQLLIATEASIWIVSFALVVLGVVKAAYSEHPLFWLAISPAPIVLISTITVFLASLTITLARV